MKRWMIVLLSASLVALVVGGVSVLKSSHRSNKASAVQDQGAKEQPAGADSAGSDANSTQDADAGAVVDEARARAFEEAQASGTAGVPGPINHTPTPGWGQAQAFTTSQDDWEPAVAADPGAPYVYMIATEYSGPNACGTCPDVKLKLRTSTDGGQTFGAPTYLCPCAGGKNQYDPEIDVAADGTIYAAWLQGYTPGVSISKSTDHGLTWTPPVSVDSPWSDKPVLVTAPNGNDVYVAFNGPTAGDAYVAQSHDGGASWTTGKVYSSDRYTFAGGGYATDSGLVVFAENDFNNNYSGNVRTFVLVSTNSGSSFNRYEVDTGKKQPDCTSTGCYDGYYGSVPAVSGDGNGDLAFAYARANVRGGQQRVYVSTSSDQGQNWSAGVQVSANTGLGAFPAIVGVAGDEFRLVYMDKSTGRWNEWFRVSTDGGQNWTAPVRISNATSGAPYISVKGYREAYGDYQEVTVTNTGATFAAWGEGPSYYGPGGVWYNQRN